jgi:hypothetical protein
MRKLAAAASTGDTPLQSISMLDVALLHLRHVLGFQCWVCMPAMAGAAAIITPVPSVLASNAVAAHLPFGMGSQSGPAAFTPHTAGCCPPMPQHVCTVRTCSNTCVHCKDLLQHMCAL